MSSPGPTDAPGDLLADLTDAQREAVTHGEGPLLILAGAGSGKTRVITRRVAYLLQQGVRPGNILAITFTNKAAGEMRQRVERLVPGNRVWVSTFHSLGARLLRQYADRLNIDRNFTIYDTDDRARLVKDALAAAGIDDVKFTPERIAGAIGKAKNQLQTPRQFAETARDFFHQTVARVYGLYEKRLRDANAMDFDDLLYLPAIALRTNEELRADLDARFRYVLIDEYQDTNHAQYEIARRLSMHYRNLCVVGDPDQCLPPGTLVATPTGPKPIEQIRDGDQVLSALGGGRVGPATVEKVMANPFLGELLEFTLADGTTVRATPNHRFFARWGWGQVELCVGIRRTQAAGGGPLPPLAPVIGPATAVHPQADAMLGMFDYALPDDQRAWTRMSASGAFFACMPANFLRVGCVLPVLRDGAVGDEELTRREPVEYDGPVYDLSVPATRNFIANGVAVHNSIYKWRGSDIKNILDFERDFPDARVITLERNYRSTKAILHAASTVIDHNKQRKKKTLVTDNPQGEPVRVLTFDSGLDEAEGVVVRIKEAVKSGTYRYRDHAIFLRINALTRSLESAFVKHGVPFQIVKGLAFFERKENRDVLAYLRLLVNPQDAVSFLRVVNEPPRGIGKVSLDKLQRYAADNEISLLAAAGQVHMVPEIKGKAAAGLRDFYRLIADLRTQLELPPHEVIRLVLDKSGYRKMLSDSGDEEDAERLANIEELVTAAKQFSDEDTDRTLGDFLEQITLASDVDSWDEKSDCVSVMTLHAAKGLEFPVVYILAVEQGLLPHERSLGQDEDVEEERRLCFVGMTRAMKELYLCHSRLRDFRGNTLYAVPSMFLEELPAEVEHDDLSAAKNFGRAAIEEWRTRIAPAAADAGYPARPARPDPLRPTIPDPPDAGYAPGQVVQHDEYGIGQITDVSGFGALQKMKVRFAAAGEKTFIADKVKLKVVRRK